MADTNMGLWDRYVKEGYDMFAYTVKPLLGNMGRLVRKAKIHRGKELTSMDYYGVAVGGGFEHGQFLYIANISLLANCEPRDKNRRRLKREDVILEMNGHQLCGMTSDDAHGIMEGFWKNGEPLRIIIDRHVSWPFCSHVRSSVHIANILQNYKFYNGSAMRQILHTTRETIYSLYPPITNRPRKENEPGPEDGGYVFASDDQIAQWIKSKNIIEHGQYEGNQADSMFLSYGRT